MRAAGIDGKADHYTFVHESDPSLTLSLPGVTSVIGEVIAKPALVNWAAKLTREGVLGMVADLSPDERLGDVYGFGSDARLVECLKERGYTPKLQKEAGGDRGTAAHEYFAKLVASTEPITPTNLYEAGVLDWHLAFRPEAALLEEVAPHPHTNPWAYAEVDTTYHLVRNGVPDPTCTVEVASEQEIDGYCGTLDFEGVVSAPGHERGEWLVDLKTRKPGDKMNPYHGERLQVGALWLARGARTDVRTALLIVNGDGSYAWHPCDPARDAEAFLHVLETHRWMKESR